jgi:hypothetical protein
MSIEFVKVTSYRSEGRKLNQDDDRVRVTLDMSVNEFRSQFHSLMDKKESEDKVQKFWDKVVVLQGTFPSWRAGQIYFNALEETFPTLASEVRATDSDPYHIDKNIPRFFKFIEDRLGDHV